MRYPLLVAADKKSKGLNSQADERFLPYSKLAMGALIFLAVLGLFLVFEVSYQGQPSHVTLAYYKERLRRDPLNRTYRLKLAETYFDLGRLREARRVASLIKVNQPETAFEWQVAWLNYRIDYRRYMKQRFTDLFDPLSSKRQALLAQQADFMMFAPLSSQQLKQLAMQASAIDEPRLAFQAYLKAMQLQTTTTPGDYHQIGTYALQAKQYSQCADYRWNAFELAQDRSSQRYYFDQATQCLVSGNRPKQALKSAKAHLKPLNDDPATLLFMARLAEQADQSQSAFSFLKKALAYNPPFWNTANIAYRVYLANEAVEKAYQIAAKAAKKNPQSFQWRLRLAQSASWTGRLKLSLKNWLYLGRHDYPAGYQQAEALAGQMRNYRVLVNIYKKALKANPYDRQKWHRLAQAYEGLGQPNKAVSVLKKALNEVDDPKFVKHIARLYQTMDEPQQAYEWLNRYVAEVGINPELALSLAKLDLLFKRPGRALSWLENVKTQASPKSVEFWRYYADLHWQYQSGEKALEGYRRLSQLNALTATEQNRYVYLLEGTDTGKALQQAYAYWQQHQTLTSVTTVLRLAANNERADLLKPVLQSLSARQKRQLRNRPEYWRAKLIKARADNSHVAVMKAYEQALKRVPDSRFVKANLINYLAESQRQTLLNQSLRRFKGQASTQSPLRDAYVNGHATLGNYKQALYYQHLTPAEQRSYSYWVTESSLLDIMGHKRQAREASAIAWRLMVKRQRQNSQFLQGAPLTTALLVSRLLAPVQVQLKLVHAIQFPLTPDQAGELAGWAYDANNTAILKALYLRPSLVSGQLPAWLRMDMALNHRDYAAVDQLLNHEWRSMTRAMRARAYRDTNNWRDAKQTIYHAYEHNPDSDVVQGLFNNIMLARANRVQWDSVYRTFGSLEGWWNTWNGQYWAYNNWRIKPLVSLYRTRSSDQSQLIAPEDFMTRAIAELNYIDDRRRWRFVLGGWEGIKAQPVAKVFWQYQIHPWLVTRFNVNYNAVSEENTRLLLSGKQHEFAGELEEQMTPRDRFNQSARERIFYSQGNHYLGQSQLASATYTHYFRNQYPDWNTTLFGEYYQYTRNGDVDSTLAQTLPEGTAATVEAFLPGDFSQYGLVAGWGQTDLEQYTPYWRTFGSLSLFNNTLLDFGYNALLGLSGPVLGDDHLVFYLRDSQNQQVVTTKNRQIGLKYQVYY